MSENDDWKEETFSAVTSLSTAVSSSTATGFPEVARTSANVTYVIVNNFYLTPSPESVDDQVYRELESKVGELEAQLSKVPQAQTHAFACKRDFNVCWQTAATKRQKMHCLMAYSACLAHGFNISVNIGT